MSLIDEHGLKIDEFEASLASILGDKPGQEGARVMSWVARYDRRRGEFRDWIYCLCSAPDSLMRQHLLDSKGKAPETFVDLLEKGVNRASEPGDEPRPVRMTSNTVAPLVIEALSTARLVAQSAGKPQITEAALSLVLLENAPPELANLLNLWCGEPGFRKVIVSLGMEVHGTTEQMPADCFDDRVLTSSASRFKRRLLEDAQSLCAQKITTRHVLYTLLGNDGSPLSLALASLGFNVRKELHAGLSRELVQRGQKRNDQLRLSPEHVMGSVRQLMNEAYKLAQARGEARLNVQDVCRAFASRLGNEITRLAPGHSAMQLPAIQTYLQTALIDEEKSSALPRLTTAEIRTALRERILGQDIAIDRIIPWIKRLQFGLPREDRPAAVFLFLGPTGTGKTQMAKELAKYVLGDPEMMIFLEMGQFQTPESMNMFIGAPPGYVGYGDGKLTNGLRDRPRSVVLFDEIEKAARTVFDSLLRFADEGLISDPAGPVRDGRNCIIVLTTNAGQTWLMHEMQRDPSIRDHPDLPQRLFDKAMEQLYASGFRPEFLGRVDESIVFLPFTPAACHGIVQQVLAREGERLARLKGVTLTANEQALKVLRDIVFERSAKEGARGAPRAINEFIITPLIDRLTELGEQGKDGAGCKFIIGANGDGKIEVEVDQ